MIAKVRRRETSLTMLISLLYVGPLACWRKAGGARMIRYLLRKINRMRAAIRAAGIRKESPRAMMRDDAGLRRTGLPPDPSRRARSAAPARALAGRRGSL